MIEELTKSIQMQLTERLNSPFIGSFAISWCIWNYKFFIIIFSHEPVISIFTLIHIYVFPSCLTILIKGFIGPICTSLIYIFAYPYFAREVYEFTRKRQRDILQIRQRIQEETPLTLEESRKIYSENFEISSRREEDRARYSMEIERLNNIINGMNPPGEKLYKKVGEGDLPSLSPSQIELISYIGACNGRAFENDVYKDVKEERVQLDFDLEYLLENNYITKQYDNKENQMFYLFTQSGRASYLRYINTPL